MTPVLPVETLKDIRRRLHQIPEAGFQEFKTQAFLLEILEPLRGPRITIETFETGLFVHIAGLNPKRRIAYRCDIDGLPILEETGYSFQSVHDGYMHACGHDMHMTVAIGIVSHFAAVPMDDDLLVIFQPAEEGPGGAVPMLGSTALQKWRPDAIFALHIAPEYPVGTVATRVGMLFANTSELFIELTGTGGHAAYPHRANDMVVAAAHLVTQLQTIVARNVDPLDSAVITVGKIEGGTRQNVIAERARLEGTIRTKSLEAMTRIKTRIEQLTRGIESGFDCTVTIDYGANYRHVWNNETWTADFMKWLETTGTATLIVAPESMTGEDFGYFLAEIPGFMFWLGVDSPHGLHHAKLAPSEDAIGLAVDVMTGYLLHISKKNG